MIRELFNFKTKWLLKKGFWLEISMKEGGFYINLKNFKIYIGSVSKKSKIASNLATWAKVSSKSKPSSWENPMMALGSIQMKGGIGKMKSIRWNPMEKSGVVPK